MPRSSSPDGSPRCRRWLFERPWAPFEMPSSGASGKDWRASGTRSSACSTHGIKPKAWPPSSRSVLRSGPVTDGSNLEEGTMELDLAGGSDVGPDLELD